MLANTGINVIGQLGTGNGVGQSARGFVRALEFLQMPMGYADISVADQEKVDSAKWRAGKLLDDALINLVVANPFPLETYEVEKRIGFETLRRSYNIGSWWWELATAPSSWQRGSVIFDEVWAGSEFVRQAFAESFSLPIHKVSPVVEALPAASLSREHFSFGRDETIFLFMCDFLSIPERKNPLGLVRAFRQAFKSDDKARLLIKVVNEDAYPQYWQTLKEACEGSNITLVAKRLPRRELDSLIAHADCYVSLHRSEGFGLTMAESMLAGKPVVGTAYSGNMDFMNDDNSYLVPYRLVEIGQDYRPYSRNQQWAEPDTAAASHMLRLIHDDLDTARAKGMNAAAFIQKHFSVEAVARSIKVILEDNLRDNRFESRKLANLKDRSYSAGYTEAAPLPMVVPLASSARDKVSICLPVFNGQEYLEEAIESLLAQTYDCFELLIADDCSSDNSWEIINSFAARDSRIICWQNDSRLGLFDNYNECIRRSSGAYIKPFAQDDILDREYLSVAMQAMKESPALMLFSCRRSFINELGRSIDSLERDHAYSSRTSLDTVTDGTIAVSQCIFPVMNKIGEPSAVMFPRTAVGSGFDSSFYHVGDLEYWFRIVQEGTYFCSSRKLCSFRLHGTSTTTRNMKSLLFALDLLRLGRKHEAAIVATGRSLSQYI